MSRFVRSKLLAAGFFLLVLAACGGGGGGNPQPQQPQPTTTYTVGGTATGVSGSLVLRLNGSSDLNVSTGPFTFTTALPTGTAYAVTIATAPATQDCTIASGGSGTVASSNITNVTVACTNKTVTIGGTLSGLLGTVVLQNNGGNNLSLSANGGFTFGASVNSGATYDVTVLTQPTGQTCTISNGSGLAATDVASVAVACTNNTVVTRSIGGTVTGLVGSVVLQNNGGNSLTVSANGNFTFGAPVNDGATYNVTVATQPTGQSCAVGSGSGTATANVTNVAITCTNNTVVTRSIGGTVTGLVGTVVLQNNGGNDTSLSANGNFTFGATVNDGETYNVTVLTQPVAQTCVVNNGAGTANANVTNVAVTCTTKTFTIGGALTNLNGTLVLQNNGGNNLSLSANGSFTFSAAVNSGAAYDVTVLAQPAGQTCTVTNGSGTAAANVSNVAVNCVYPQLAANGKSLTVTTTSTIATFAGADLVGLQNRLTGETYLKNASAGELANVNTVQGTGQSLQTSSWSVAPDSGTGLPVASIVVSDSVRTLTVKVNIDATSQEVVVKAAASVTRQGVRDASWSIAGLDLAGGHLIVPSHTGEVFDAAHPPLASAINYPWAWQAQMFVYETARGSFVAYSTDSQYRSKDLRSSTRGQDTVDLAIVTEANGPFGTATSVPEIEWRLQSFAGDWKVAAQPYKTWLNVDRPPVVRSSSVAWAANIRTVVTMHTLDESQLDLLAATPLLPAKTLIYIPNWRASPYDVNYPDYTPGTSPSAASFVAKAHTLGFKVMVHFDLVGVSPLNPDYASVSAFHLRNPEDLSLMGNNWTCASCSTRYAFIDPASSTYRALLIQRIGTAVTAVNPDALHLDISAPMFNDGNGLIEGMNYAQGSARLHEQLIAQFPNLAIGGEGENDILYRYDQFAQAFFYFDDSKLGHPIVNFLFSPQVRFYGHLGQPIAKELPFREYLSDVEHRSITPAFPVAQASDFDTTVRDNARLIDLLTNWQNNAFQPDWNSDWTGARVRYTGLAGSTATLTDSGTVETLSAAGATLYELTDSGANQVASTSYISGWPAFDGTKLYGLDPAKRYWLDALPRPSTTTHVTNIPAGNVLGSDTFVTSAVGRFDFGAPVAAGAFDFEDLLSALLGIHYQGSDWPLAYGAVVVPTTMTVGGVARSALNIQTPWQGQIGGETFAEYSVPVSAGGQLRFSVGIGDGATCNNDGVTFRVTVNDLELYSQNYHPGAWHDGAVDLSAYANQTVRLRIISNPGPQGSANCDWSAWSQLGIVYPPAATPTISVPVSLDSSGSFSGFAGDGSSSFSAGTVANLPTPGRFVVFTQPGAAIANGTNLLSLVPPVDIWSGLRGEMLTKGGVFGAGTIGGATIGGVTKIPAMTAHPPYNGRSMFSWTLRVPDAPAAMSLSWAVGLLNTVDPSTDSDGVDVSVWINGVPYWQTTTSVAGWLNGSIELRQWQGQNVFVQFVTDSRANNDVDSTFWADLITNTSSVTCSYGLAPAQATVSAQGGQQSLTVNVTGGSTCPWAASSSVPWATITSGTGHPGSGTLVYTVAQNTSAPRAGTLVVAGQTFTIKQADSNGNLPP